ncbi:MAG: EamA family transporter [Oscillospiraceae bacterium]
MSARAAGCSSAAWCCSCSRRRGGFRSRSTPPVALGTLEISVVGTALAFTLYLQGVSDVGGVRASLLACTEPVSATLCAALWLHTSFAWQDLLGFAAILVMAVLIALPERASEKSTEKAEN